jgi:hypothetical protein
MMAISEELYKKLELADFTKDDISLFREKTNAKVAKQGKDASSDLIGLANFLNEAESSAMQMAAQGATFNFSEELTAPLQGTFPKSFYLAVERDAMDTYKRENPIKSSFAQVGGSLLPQIADGAYRIIGSRFSKGKQTPGLFPESPTLKALSEARNRLMGPVGGLGNAVKRSGIYGTAYTIGADEGSAKERMTKWKPYITGIAAAALAVPSHFMSRVFSTLADKIGSYPSAEKGEERALEMIVNAMEADAGSVEEALVLAHNAMNQNKQLTLADVSSSNAAILDLVGVLPYKGTKLAKDFLQARMDGRFGRLNSDLIKAYGPKASYFETLDALIETRKAEAAPLYKKAFMQEVPLSEFELRFNPNADPKTIPRTIDLNQEFIFKNSEGSTEVDTINTLLYRPSLQRAANMAEKIALEDGVILPDFEMTTNGLAFASGENKGKLIDEVDMQFLHYMKLALDNELSIANKPLSTSMGNVELAKMMNSKNKFLTILDSNPEYKEARKIFAGSMATQEAMDFGLNIFTNKAYKANPEKVISLYNDSEKEAFRNGVFESVLRKMETSTDDSNMGLKIIGDPRKRKLLQLAFPEDVGEDAFNEFINNFQQEIDSRAVEIKVLKGSQTAQRNALKEDFMQKSARAMNTRQMTQDELINSMMSQDFDLLNDEQRNAMSQKLAEILTQTEYNRLEDNLRKGFPFGAALMRVNPLSGTGWLLNFKDLVGSPYAIGEITSMLGEAGEDAGALDLEKFGTEAKNKAIEIFNQEEKIDDGLSRADNFQRTVPSSVASEVMPKERQRVGEQLDQMLASFQPSNIPLVPPANAIRPQDMINETILPNPKDRELAERQMMRSSGIGSLA